MNAIRIRNATRDDAELLARLHAQCFDEAWDEASFSAFLREASTFALLAGDVSAPRAFILVRVAADESEILTLGTLPASRRSGLARSLVAAALAEAHERGARRIFLEVAADNDAALSLYTASGFAPSSLRPAYYPRATGRGADALILSAALPTRAGCLS